MSYKFKQYGPGFEILGKRDGWHYGIWTDSMPKAFVFLKPVNKNDFVFCDLTSHDGNMPNSFCGVLKPFWLQCVNGVFTEISEEDAQKLLNTKMMRYSNIPSLKYGDVIRVLEPQSDDGNFVECRFIETNFTPEGLFVLCETPWGFNLQEKADDYGKTWLIKKERNLL